MTKRVYYFLKDARTSYDTLKLAHGDERINDKYLASQMTFVKSGYSKAKPVVMPVKQTLTIQVIHFLHNSTF